MVLYRITLEESTLLLLTVPVHCIIPRGQSGKGLGLGSTPARQSKGTFAYLLLFFAKYRFTTICVGFPNVVFSVSYAAT